MIQYIFEANGSDLAVLDGPLVTLQEVVTTARRIAESERLALPEVSIRLIEIEGDDRPLKATGWPEPTVAQPDIEQLLAWERAGGCEATDGCGVELDGTCIHGHPSWALVMGLV